MTIFNPKFSPTEHLLRTIPAVSRKSVSPEESHDAAQTVMIGDCLDILPAIRSSSVDVVITSPPYNIGVDWR